MKKQILNLSYNFGLAKTRESLLESVGYSVMTAMSHSEALKAIRHCGYGLAILGHSIEQGERQKLIREIKSCHPNTPVLCLQRHDTLPDHGADYCLRTSEGPEALLEMVQTIFEDRDKELTEQDEAH